MYSNFKLIVLLVGISIANLAAGDLKPEILGEHSLLNFMTRTRDISNQNPQRSMECFSYYIPILNEITAEYERSYSVCLSKANDSRSAVDKTTKEDRKNIEKSARDSCQVLFDCSQHKSSVDYFECYVDGGSQNSKTMYTISNNASDILVNVREQYRLIENEEFRCTNASERAYVEQTANTHNELQSCIMGLSPVPSSFADTKSPQDMPVAVKAVEVPVLVEEQAENLNEKHTKQYYVEKGINKFKRPIKLH